LTNETPDPELEGELIRSERQIYNDLISWGFKFDANKKRPYFEGHERPDVVDHRKKFYFLDRKVLFSRS
jgi:hypothetical protein